MSDATLISVADWTARLLELTHQRAFQRVVDTWKNLPVEFSGAEIPSRLAAAAYGQLGDLNRAASILRHAISTANVEATTLALAGRIFFDAGDSVASLTAWERAMASQPENLGWWVWFARVALEAKQPERALRGAEVFTFHRETNEDASILYAALMVGAQRVDEALIATERTLARWPHHPVAGPAYAEFVMREFPFEARKCLSSAAWRPKAPPPLTAARVRASLWMPALFETEESAAQWREDLLGEIAELTALAQDGAITNADRALCLSSTPFFAAFHDADVTPIQFAWGDFVEALVSPLRRERFDSGTLPVRPRRIGIVSNRFTDSSAGRFFNGWIPDLLANGFAVTLYALGATDHETARLSALTTLHRFPRDDVAHSVDPRDQIERDKNDVLLFPEPQGSPLTILLAGLKLAPVQCSAFGNPITTGLSTMDFFFSPDAAEVAFPARHYREQVIRLRGIGTLIAAAPKPSALDRTSFGFAQDENIYLVNQQLQKWTPRFLGALAEILQRDRKGRLVYFSHGAHVSTRAFQSMLRDLLSSKQIDMASRVLCVANFWRDDYLALNQAGDVSLDTFGYGGGSSTADAISSSLPVVTREGDYLRARQSAGMLRLAGQSDLICTDTEAFIDRAIEVARSRRRMRPALSAENESARTDIDEAGHNPDAVRSSVEFASVSDFLLSL